MGLLPRNALPGGNGYGQVREHWRSPNGAVRYDMALHPNMSQSCGALACPPGEARLSKWGRGMGDISAALY